MFSSIRRHQSWIWIIVVVLVSISMLWFFTDQPQGGGGGTPNFGSIKGRPNTLKEYQEAFTETRLLYFLNFQKWPDKDTKLAQNFDVEQQAYYRLLRLSQAKEANIQVSDQTVAEMVRRILGPDPKAFDTFVNQQLKEGRITANDFERFLRHDAAIQQLGTLGGLSGRFITPREAEAIYRREHQEIEADVVFFNPSNYLAGVNMSLTNINPWYTNRMSTFRIPERVRVSYVEFSRSNFLAEAGKDIAKDTNYLKRVEDFYFKAINEKGTNTFTDTNGVVLAKAVAIERIKDDDLNQRAATLAYRKANAFASVLADKKPHRAEDLTKEAAVQGLKVQVSSPFEQFDGPTDLKVSPGFTRAAFALTKEEPVSFQVLGGDAGFYIIAHHETVPSENPPLESIRAKVNEQYRLEKARTLAEQAGTNFHAKVNRALLAKEKSFAFIALEEKLKSTPMLRFSQSTETLPDLEDHVDLRQFKSVAFQLEPGRVSNFVPTRPDGGFVLYVRSPRPPFNEAKLRTELPAFMGSMRHYRQNEIYSKWFSREVELAGPPFSIPPGKRGPGPN